MRPTDLIFFQKCHCIHFQENENTKKLYSVFGQNLSNSMFLEKL